jgi:dienelactone hydrolase
VPDLYRGTVLQNFAEARHLVSSFDWPAAIQDIQGTINYLKLRGVEKIGITGKLALYFNLLNFNN